MGRINITLDNAKMMMAVILLSLIANQLCAQTYHLNQRRSASDKVVYKGFDVSFGTLGTTVRSNIEKINGLRVRTEGGSAGIIFGTEVVRTTAKIGFYYSASSVPQTIDQFTARQSVNFYPIALLKPGTSRLEFYLTVGGGYHIFKFAGNYLDQDKTQSVAVRDRYIGKITQIAMNSGIGVEYKLYDNETFAHMFVEVKNSTPLKTNSRFEAFSETAMEKHLFVNIGLRFGRVK